MQHIIFVNIDKASKCVYCAKKKGHLVRKLFFLDTASDFLYRYSSETFYMFYAISLLAWTNLTGDVPVCVDPALLVQF